MKERKYFSQHGEDFLLRKLFPFVNNGFFVEIGCIDGKCFSNSLHFEQNGWRGICVEAHTDYIQLLIKNRPNSIVEHAAVGERDETSVDFFANARGSLSSLDSSKEGDFKNYGKYFTGFEVQKVEMCTLTTILKKHGIKHINFLSLDIEGYEVQALNGLDLTLYRPEVFVIESDSRMHKQEIDNILIPHGYAFITSLRQNMFYSLTKKHRSLIHNKTFKNVEITHTQHPLDNMGDRKRLLSISTGPAFFNRRVKRLYTIATNLIRKFKRSS